MQNNIIGDKPLNIKSIVELKRPTCRRRIFGPWSINRKDETITYRPNGYQIDMGRCRTCSGMVDWIFQIHRKPWVSDKDFRQLMRALNEVFRPQAQMCSFGQDLTRGADGNPLDRQA